SFQRADLVKPNVAIPGGTGVGQPYFDPLAFAAVTTARFGTAGPNLLRGPTSVQLDASVSRLFRFRERLAAELRAAAVNVSNTPHWGNAGTNVSNMQLNGDGTVKSLNGYAEITSVRKNARENTDERVLRLGLRISF